ncbi:ATP-binding protein, partial [Paenibacillus luteus]
MSVTSYQQAVRNLEYLGLKQMVSHLNEVVDFSIHNKLSFMDTFVKLTNYEIDVREHNMIHAMVKVGAFPHQKELADFAFSFQPSVNREQMLDF